MPCITVFIKGTLSCHSLLITLEGGQSWISQDGNPACNPRTNLTTYLTLIRKVDTFSRNKV